MAHLHFITHAHHITRQAATAIVSIAPDPAIPLCFDKEKPTPTTRLRIYVYSIVCFTFRVAHCMHAALG